MKVLGGFVKGLGGWKWIENRGLLGSGSVLKIRVCKSRGEFRILICEGGRFIEGGICESGFVRG